MDWRHRKSTRLSASSLLALALMLSCAVALVGANASSGESVGAAKPHGQLVRTSHVHHLTAASTLALVQTAKAADAEPAATQNAAASTTPCAFYGSGSCQSTSPQVSLYINTTFLAGFCTVNFNINWGDGSTNNFVLTTVFGELWVSLGSHTFVNAGSYTIQVSATVQSGSCVFPTYIAQFSDGPTSILAPANTIGGGSPGDYQTTCSGCPIDTGTGEYRQSFTDLSIPGRGVPLDLTRTYSSLLASQNSPFGYGWADSYDMSLSINATSGNVTAACASDWNEYTVISFCSSLEQSESCIDCSR